MRKLMLVVAVACCAALWRGPALAQDEDDREESQAKIEKKEKEFERQRKKLLEKCTVADDKVREIVIRSSGKKSKGTLILKCGPDGELVSVIDNGKLVSKKDFPRYRIQLDDAIGAIEIDELRPDLERLEKIIESRRISDEEKIEAIKEMIGELEDKESGAADLAREVYLAQLGVLGTKRMILGVPAIPGWLEACGDATTMTIRIREDGCYLNGKKLPKEMSDRLLELWKESKDIESDPDDEESGDAGAAER